MHDPAHGTFTLNLHAADGTQATEIFTEQAAFESRLEALEQQLAAEHWTARGSALLRPNASQRPN
jgi:hypothetical protein